MKPEELRIGNWYQSLTDEAEIRYSKVTPFIIAGVVDKGWNIGGVPLTEEWVERIGKLPPICLNNLEIPEWIEYVHQLQNWFYWNFKCTELEFLEKEEC